MAIHLKKFPQPEKLPPESILKLNLIAGGAIASSLVLWSLPPFVLARNDNLHRWLQALSLGGAIASSSVALAIGYKLKKVEPILHAETKQEVEDYQHWLASSRYYSEAFRETVIAAALEGETEEVKAPRQPFYEPAATPSSVFEEGTPAVPPTPPKTTPTPKPPITPPAPPPVSPTVSETYSQPSTPPPPAPPPAATNDLSFLAEMSDKERSPRRQLEPLVVRDRNDPRFQELWAKIEQPGCEWLQQLLLTKPLLIWGEQCSGKTKLAGFLALLRILFFNHQVSVADPHSHQNEWPVIFEVYGGGYDYSQVNQRLVAYYQRLKTINPPHTSIWDEVTNYTENCDSKLAGRFLKSILSDVRKPPEFPILLSHSNTLSSLGGGKGGIKKMQMRGLVEVNLRAKRDRFGNLQPALKGAVNGLEVNEKGEAIAKPIELDTWMQADYIFELFPELNSTYSVANEKDKAAVLSEFN